MRESINMRRLDEMESRAQMAESVTLPVSDFLDLIAAARNGLRRIEVLRPFAEYGELIRGQLTRHDRPLIELWGSKITGNDLIKAADAVKNDR